MKPFSTLDLETDPFLFNRLPVPFASGFHDGKITTLFWGPAAVIDSVNLSIKFNGYVYAHNGGKFDLHYLLPAIIARYGCHDVKPLCIGSRMVEIKTPGPIYRDSYALIPNPLKSFGNKKEIDIWKLEKHIYDDTTGERILCLYSTHSEFRKRREHLPLESRSVYNRQRDAEKNLLLFRQDQKRRGVTGDSPREFYREEINRYLAQDCSGLYTGLLSFFDLYGQNLTLATTTFRVLKKEFGFKAVKTGEVYDDLFRPFYFAGRVQFFSLGKHDKPGGYNIVDINSAFPWAMLQNHWYTGNYCLQTTFPSKHQEQSFYELTCDSIGALPRRGADHSVEFPDIKQGHFFATGWELIKGIELGLIANITYHKIYVPEDIVNFEPYVTHFYKLKKEADYALKQLKENPDLKLYDDKNEAQWSAQRNNGKLFLNSAYGKFALNPREFRDVKITPFGEPPDTRMPADFRPDSRDEERFYYRAKKDIRGWYKREWDLSYRDENKELDFYQKPSYHADSKTQMSFYNVCTAASITGCVRAYLLGAIHICKDVLYCDTDSVIAGDVSNLALGPELGQWRLEKENQTVWIGGKKLYVCRGPLGDYKTAAKGVRLSPEELIAVCEGQQQSYSFDAPNYSTFSAQKFTTRRINRDDKRIRRNKPEASVA